MMSCPLVGMASDDVEEHLKELRVDDSQRLILLYLDQDFLDDDEPLKAKQVKKIYKKATKSARKALPKECRSYDVRIYINGTPLENFVGTATTTPESEKKKKPTARKDRGGWWGDVSYDGEPWVKNVSRPTHAKAALAGKHLSVWQSHGRYYDASRGTWKWQRPNMFCTNEDLFTQTIVVPYLIPMLERAGANVFTPRERDWQTAEFIVDNDSPSSGYKETNHSNDWTYTRTQGFAMPNGNISDCFNPFEQGSARQVLTTKSADASTAVYAPQINKAGRYAVYVSYATVEKSIDDALYSVYHQGQRTDFHVNQQMGGGTWVYLGTFDFDAYAPQYNKVVVSSRSSSKGVVTTDAVRFGGGMGNIQRGGTVSNLPRCLEGARYYAQWAGAPYSVYGGYLGEDDYKDDINTRSLMTNWLAGGSVYVPSKPEGKHVPIDLALAVHSDAGYAHDMESIYGSLAICTTDYNNGKLDAGLSRDRSKQFAQMLLDQSKSDIKSRYGKWTWRDLYDRNYSETRVPLVPSAIFETLSHQSFPDMRLAHDPDFKFTIARSIYKSILRFEASAHGEKAIVSPLAPVNFKIEQGKNGNATLTWLPQRDKTESTATPTSYNVYMAVGTGGYDNGVNVKTTGAGVTLEKDQLYRFRITAVNDGGESFPTEELCAVWHGDDAPTVLVVNGFDRLSSPAVRNTFFEKGFDINEDPGVSYGLTAGWSGVQQVFDTSTAGREGAGTFGYSGDEMAGHFVAGNDFNYVAEHARAIAAAKQYNVVSCSKSVMEWGGVDLSRCAVVDLILGNQRNDGHSLQFYKTFTKQMQRQLLGYQQSRRGAILVSGSYIASDMQQSDEQQFLSQLLHIQSAGTVRGTNGTVTGLQQTAPVLNTLNADHYATVQSDAIEASDATAFVAMRYADGQPAAVASQSARTFAMGFPFECLLSVQQRASIMKGVLAFLRNN